MSRFCLAASDTRGTGRTGSASAGIVAARRPSDLSRGSVPRYFSTASTTCRHVSSSGRISSGNRPPKRSSSDARISIRSSESRPISVIGVSSVSPSARSLATSRTCSSTIAATRLNSSGVAGGRETAGAMRRGVAAGARLTRPQRCSQRPPWAIRCRRPAQACGAARRRGRKRPFGRGRGFPPRDDRERSVEKCLPAGVALDLAAGGLGDRSGADQHDHVQAGIRAPRRPPGGWRRSRRATFSRWRRSISWTTTSRSRAAGFDGECGPAVGRQARHGSLRRSARCPADRC